MAEAKAAGGQEFERPLAKADVAVASFDAHRKSPLQAVQHLFHANPALVPLVVLAISLAVFSLLVGERFYHPFTLTLILQQVAIVGIVGAAQTLVILTAGIDLSVGAVMVLSSVVMGQFTFRYGIPAPISILCGLGCGALCGWINGMLIAHFRLPPFIVTLGTWQIFLATNFIYSANETIRGQDLEAQAPLLLFFARNFRIGEAIFTYGVVTMILLICLLWYVLNKTAWGRHVYAIGDDPDAAELAGVQTRRMLVQVYMLAGAICALAGWVLIGRIESVAPNSGQTANIEAITAVVIGGISLFGGRGSILGTIFGALIVGVFALGLRMWGTDPQWTYLTTGLLIIIAVAVDQWIRKVAG
jgi:fructose transport system permease protein